MARADPDYRSRMQAGSMGGEAKARSPDREHYEELGREGAESRASRDQLEGHQTALGNQTRDDHGRYASER